MKLTLGKNYNYLCSSIYGLFSSISWLGCWRSRASVVGGKLFGVSGSEDWNKNLFVNLILYIILNKK